MLIFGWMGSTCLDEWTMAVSGVAMSWAVFLAGSGACSLDERYLASDAVPAAAHGAWIFSGPLPDATLRKLALWLGIACAAFTVLTYHDPVRRRGVAAALAHELPPPRHRDVGAAALPPTAA